MAHQRKFNTGAVRDENNKKANYLSYLDPSVLERFGVHMKKAELKYGRANWKLGIPQEEYLESAFRHFLTLWKQSLGQEKPTEEDHASAILFNIMGYMYQNKEPNKKI